MPPEVTEDVQAHTIVRINQIDSRFVGIWESSGILHPVRLQRELRDPYLNITLTIIDGMVGSMIGQTVFRKASDYRLIEVSDLTLKLNNELSIIVESSNPITGMRIDLTLTLRSDGDLDIEYDVTDDNGVFYGKVQAVLKRR